MVRLLWIVILCVLAAGCSRVKFAYHQLDWLIPYYVENYIELSDIQDSSLEREVEKLLHWHCGSHLSAYAELLRSANHDFQSGSMDTARLQSILNKIEIYWKEIKQQASPAIAELFLTSNQAQIDEFFAGLQERNSTWLAEYRSQSQEELRRDYQTRMTDELERWFGPLNPAQQQAVVEWSQRFKPLGMEGLEARQQWQEELRRLVSKRDDEQAFTAGIKELFVNPHTGQPVQYLSRLEQNRTGIIKLLADVGEQLNEDQRKHLADKAGSVAEDFDQLACMEKSLESQSAKVSYPADSLLGTF